MGALNSSIPSIAGQVRNSDEAADLLNQHAEMFPESIPSVAFTLAERAGEIRVMVPNPERKTSGVSRPSSLRGLTVYVFSTSTHPYVPSCCSRHLLFLCSGQTVPAGHGKWSLTRRCQLPGAFPRAPSQSLGMAAPYSTEWLPPGQISCKSNFHISKPVFHLTFNIKLEMCFSEEKKKTEPRDLIKITFMNAMQEHT